MKDTTLGIASDRQKPREVCLNLAGDYSGADSGRQFQHLSAAEGGIPKSNWNSDYWRELGAPWGGMTTTVGDLAIFCQVSRTIIAGIWVAFFQEASNNRADRRSWRRRSRGC